MMPSRVGLRWTCVSTTIGITVLPARLTRAAPAGTRTSAAVPTWAIFAPSTTTVAFSITRPSPTITRAPSYTVTLWADAGIASPARTPTIATATSATAFIRRMDASRCLARVGSARSPRHPAHVGNMAEILAAGDPAAGLGLQRRALSMPVHGSARRGGWAARADIDAERGKRVAVAGSEWLRHFGDPGPDSR